MASKARFGATTLSITHDIASARRIAIRIAMIINGSIIWSGVVDKKNENGKTRAENLFDRRSEGPNQMQVRRL